MRRRYEKYSRRQEVSARLIGGAFCLGSAIGAYFSGWSTEIVMYLLGGILLIHHPEWMV